MRFRFMSIRRVERYPVASVTNAGSPPSDSSGAVVSPLETTQSIALFSWQVLHVPFCHFADSLGLIQVAPESISFPSSGICAGRTLTCPTISTGFADASFPCHGCDNSLLAEEI